MKTILDRTFTVVCYLIAIPVVIFLWGVGSCLGWYKQPRPEEKPPKKKKKDHPTLRIFRGE